MAESPIQKWLDVMVFKPHPLLTGEQPPTKCPVMADLERALEIIRKNPTPPEIVASHYVPEGKGYYCPKILPNKILVGPATYRRLYEVKS